jgi:anti-anti-sigma factor
MSGALDATTDQEYQAFIRPLQDSSNPNLLFDMKGCMYVNETGPDSLIVTANDTEYRGGRMALFNVEPRVRVVFEMMGLDKYLRMFDSKEAAITYLAGSNP